MRGPRDALPSESAERDLRPPGGKVSDRLLLFEQERGFPDPGDVDGSRERARTREVGPARRRKGSRARRQKAGGLTSPAIGLLYASAAAQLHPLTGMGGGPRALPDAAAAEPETRALPPAWRWLGPTVMPNGQTYGDTRPPVAGRVAAIAVDPSDGHHVLCGSAAGGVWESHDTGATWAPRTDSAPTLTVGALAFDPSNPATVYCGTGEGNFYRRLGAGVLRSTDGGTTWELLAGAPFIGQGFFDLVVDPADGNHIVAATTGGVYESADAGGTWAQRRATWAWDVAMHPDGGASAEVLAACNDGLFRSADGGTTWAGVALPGAPNAWDRLAVDIARSDPRVAYAFGSANGTPYLYRRAPAGAGTSWKAIALPNDLDTAQAWYDWYVMAARDVATQVYLGAIEAYRGDLGAAWSWVKISNKAGDDIHPDQHCLAIDPSNPDVIYAGNDGGLYRSPDRGMAWQSLNDGLGIAEIEYIAQDYGSSRWLIGGTQDNGSIRWTGNPAWDHIADGDGGDCAVNRASPSTVFHTYYNMGMERSTTRGDFGSFSWVGPNVPAGYRNLFYPPVESNGDVIAMAGQSVYVSRNNGTAWSNVALPAGEVASGMIMPTPNRVLVGTTSGNIYRIDWGGAAWGAAVALAQPRPAWISDLHVDAANLNRIWVAYSQLGGGRLYRSDDGGTTWTDCSEGLPGLPVNAVQVDPVNADRIWAAADVGVYQSLDAGASWQPFSIGLPNVLVADLLFHPHARVLRAGTRNRGVWEVPVDGWPSEPICGVQFSATLTARQTRRWYSVKWPATWHVVWTVVPTAPISAAGAPQVTWKVQPERATAEYVTYWIVVTNLTGAPVSFEGRYAILSRY